MICTTLLLINLSGQPWTNKDITIVTQAEHTCNKIYKTCVSKITKKDSLLFEVRCGVRNE